MYRHRRGVSAAWLVLVLFETPARFVLFKVQDEGKISEVEVSGSDTSIYLPVVLACRICGRVLARQTKQERLSDSSPCLDFLVDLISYCTVVIFIINQGLLCVSVQTPEVTAISFAFKKC